MEAYGLRGVTMALGNAGLNLDTGATTYDLANGIDFAINGKAYTKSSVSNGTTPTTDGDSAALTDLSEDEGAVYVLTLDSSGTVDVWQSEIGELDSAGNFKDGELPGFPYVDLTLYCPIAYIVVQCEASGGFVFGTTNWDATDITSTGVDVITLPQRPQSS